MEYVGLILISVLIIGGLIISSKYLNKKVGNEKVDETAELIEQMLGITETLLLKNGFSEDEKLIKEVKNIIVDTLFILKNINEKTDKELVQFGIDNIKNYCKVLDVKLTDSQYEIIQFILEMCLKNIKNI